MNVTVPRHQTDTPSTPSTADPSALPHRPDPTFFNTVLRSEPQQQVVGNPLRSLDNGAAAYPPELPDGPFDMLGFIGEITSELQQKHSDLTNGVSQFTGLEPMNAVNGFALSADRQVFPPGTSGIATASRSEGAESISPTSSSVWLDTRATYEEQLLVHFLGCEPPPTIFGPVNMEWKHVKPAILAQSREFSPLVNAIYCFSDVHKSMLDGSRWKLAPNYHRLASEEVQSCILGDVSEDVLKRVFTTIFLLMLSEVCFGFTLYVFQTYEYRCCALQNYAELALPLSTRHICYFKDSTIQPSHGLD